MSGRSFVERMHRRGAQTSKAVVVWAAIASAFALVSSAWCQTPALRRGKFLVASLELTDPNFSETVVLILEYSDRGAVGLVVNRPSDRKISDLLPEIEPLKKRGDLLFVGGPVAPDKLTMLLRSAEAPKESRRLFEDIHVSRSEELLRRLAAAKGGKRRFRVYAGYAGWSAGQLDAEVARGGWHIVPADPDLVFSEDPGRVWRWLLTRDPSQWAMGTPEERGAGGPAAPGVLDRPGVSMTPGTTR